VRDEADDEILLLAPESAGRHGSVPQVVRRPSLESEASFIADWLKQRHAAGRPWNEMAVLYRAKFVAEKAVAALKAAGIPVEWLRKARGSRRFAPGGHCVKVMTMHSDGGSNSRWSPSPGRASCRTGSGMRRMGRGCWTWR
jgi:hypothetical protein